MTDWKIIPWIIIHRESVSYREKRFLHGKSHPLGGIDKRARMFPQQLNIETEKRQSTLPSSTIAKKGDMCV